MAIGTKISEQQIKTTAQKPQQSIMNQLFNWLRLKLVNVFGWLFAAREQLPPSQSDMQASRRRFFANEGPALSAKKTGPLNMNTNIGEGEIRSRNTPLSLSTLSPEYDIYMNTGAAVDADSIESLNTTTNIGRQSNDRS